MNRSDMVCNNNNSAPDSLTTLSYTYQYDKYSCYRPMYFVHLTFAYLVVICGTACLVCRILAPHYHAMFGRLYIVCMLWCMGTSLLIHNTGLPAAVLVSFVWVLGGLTVGWFLIKVHQEQMLRLVFRKLYLMQDKTALNDHELNTLLSKTRREISATKTWSQRMFSLKAAHGTLMFMSYFNMLGRLFSSDQSGRFGCYTYHVYKPLDSYRFDGLDKPITYVPENDPDRSKLPWSSTGLLGWGVLLSIGPVVLGFGFGCLWTLCHARKLNCADARKGIASSSLSTIKIP